MRQKTARKRQPMGDGCGAGRDILDQVGDKWSMYVLFLLGEHRRRFMDLRRSIEDISQRMPTVTLRNLECDGMISRTMYAIVPPRVDYALTRSGEGQDDSSTACGRGPSVTPMNSNGLGRGTMAGRAARSRCRKRPNDLRLRKSRNGSSNPSRIPQPAALPRFREQTRVG